MATSSQSTPNVHAMKMNHYYLSYSHLPLLGIDVSKATFDAHLLLAQERSASHSFPNSPKGFAELQAWLDEFQAHSTYAGLEATGPYGHALLVFLHDQGHTACLLNARHVKDHARSQAAGSRLTGSMPPSLPATCAPRDPLPGSLQLRSSRSCKPWCVAGCNCSTPSRANATASSNCPPRSCRTPSRPT